MSSGEASAASVRRTAGAPSRSAREGDLGHDQRGRLEARPVRRGTAVGGEREAADRHRPAAGRPPPGSVTAAAASARQRSATVAKRSGPPASQSYGLPSPASAAWPRSGCSKANHCSPGRREAHTTAVGSTSAGSASEIVASVSRPAARAARAHRGLERRGGRRSSVGVGERKRLSVSRCRAPARSRCAPARSRSRPCASSRSARTDGPCPRTPRSCRSCPSPR